jgi:hypothetical protein
MRLVFAMFPERPMISKFLECFFFSLNFTELNRAANIPEIKWPVSVMLVWHMDIDLCKLEKNPGNIA